MTQVHQIIAYVFAGIFLLFAVIGYLQRARRAALWAGAVFAAAGFGAAWSDAFWPTMFLAVLTLSAGLAALEIVDLGWRVRAGLVLSVVALGFLALWPTLETLTGGRLPCPAWVEDRQNFRLVAGLDLRGGLRLVYTVDVDEAIKDKRDHYYEEMRASLAKVYGLHSGDDRPSEETLVKLRELVRVEAPKRPANVLRLVLSDKADPAKVDARFLNDFRADLTYSQSADKKSWEFRIKEEAETGIRERAVNQAREIILRRVDELGLREAAVSTRDEDIIIEVPGKDEKDFATIREIISQTARLEFKLLDDDDDFMGRVAKEAKPESLPEGLEFLRENAPVGLDDNGDQINKQVTYAFIKKGEKETSLEALQRMKEWAATLEPPPDREVGFELARVTDPDTQKETEDGWRTYLLRSRADITGDMVRDAAAVPDQGQGSLGGWHVALTFTDQGGNIFDRITSANVKRRFAIILDNRVESTPVILTRIAGGNASITMGSGDPEIQLRDSRKLELVLRSGALPAPISPSNEQSIGPSLGRDSIRLGVQGAVGGGLLVLIFMVMYYRRAGLIADVTVSLNLFLQLAVLATFGASMTLPGIAGLALTIGMSVDANVLINERIREELKSGKSPRAAVELGYSKALSAIVDGQLTTLISGVVLAQYGTGPIKGFAVTLIVGVTISIFTALVVSRVLFDLWVRGFGRLKTLDVG
ncbi:MAG: protein translocase subunit SecD [Polyangiaceae bacterium]